MLEQKFSRGRAKNDDYQTFRKKMKIMQEKLKTLNLNLDICLVLNATEV